MRPKSKREPDGFKKNRNRQQRQTILSSGHPSYQRGDHYIIIAQRVRTNGMTGERANFPLPTKPQSGLYGRRRCSFNPRPPAPRPLSPSRFHTHKRKSCFGIKQSHKKYKKLKKTKKKEQNETKLNKTKQNKKRQTRGGPSTGSDKPRYFHTSYFEVYSAQLCPALSDYIQLCPIISSPVQLCSALSSSGQLCSSPSLVHFFCFFLDFCKRCLSPESRAAFRRRIATGVTSSISSSAM